MARIAHMARCSALLTTLSPLSSSQAWFMEGKEGKEYKPNSLHQIMRRLGFFPTMRSSRAGKLTPPDLPPAPRPRLTLLMQAIPCVVRLFTPSFFS